MQQTINSKQNIEAGKMFEKFPLTIYVETTGKILKILTQRQVRAGDIIYSCFRIVASI